MPSVHIIDNNSSFVNTLQGNILTILLITNYAKMGKQKHFEELANDSGQVKDA